MTAKRMSKARFYLGDTLPAPASNGSETYTQVGGTVTVNGPGPSKQMVDVTDMEDNAMVFLSDVPDGNTMTITGFVDETDAGLARLEADAFIDNARRWCRVESLIRADNSVVATYDFLGEVQDHGIEHSRGSSVPINATVKISGPITKTVA
ncbi:MAG: hypothetical protein AAGA68_26540 [Pseudomonadota bacterium]